jgi:hypothetical protein
VPPAVATAQPEPAKPATAEPPAPPAIQSSAPEPEQELQPVETPQMAAAAPGLAPQLQSAMPEPAAPKPAPKAGAGASGPGVATPVTAQPPTTFEPPRVAPPAVDVKVTALPLKDGATLYFDWPKPVALAVFRRGDALWLVFDAPGKADLKALGRVEPVIGKVEGVPSSFSLALRLTGGSAASPLTATEGARWKVTLRPGQAMAPVQPLQQRRETLPNGGTSFYVQAIASGAAVDLQDPTDRTRLVVTPEQLPGLGVARQSDWPDFKLLPSYQGVVVATLNDRPKVQASPNGVVVVTPPQASAEAKPAPSSVSRAETPKPDATAEAGASPEASPPPPVIASVPKPLSVTAGLFDMKKWRRGGAATFLADRETLSRRVNSAAPADKNRALLDLAEFLLANGYFPEAAGRCWRMAIRSPRRTISIP